MIIMIIMMMMMMIISIIIIIIIVIIILNECMLMWRDCAGVKVNEMWHDVRKPAFFTTFEKNNEVFAELINIKTAAKKQSWQYKTALSDMECILSLFIFSNHYYSFLFSFFLFF